MIIYTIMTESTDSYKHQSDNELSRYELARIVQQQEGYSESLEYYLDTIRVQKHQMLVD